MTELKSKPKRSRTLSIKKTCVKCLTDKSIKDYYKSKNPMFAIDGLVPMCKECIKSLIPDYTDTKEVLRWLRLMDIYYSPDLWKKALKSQDDSLGRHISIVNSLRQYKYFTYSDSIFPTDEDQIEFRKVTNPEISIDDNNKEDVLRLLGYDPFLNERDEDKASLYGKLVEFLDESTLEDTLKLESAIVIVKTFNQISKVDAAISSLDPKSKATELKSLSETKARLAKSVLELAKDNGISVNHSNDKSKGSNTLSGIIKTLQEKKFQEAEINIYDILTSDGMRQVADISNKSIMSQLQFDENDYTEMIQEQRTMIEQIKNELLKTQEENRLLKLHIKSGDANVKK